MHDLAETPRTRLAETQRWASMAGVERPAECPSGPPVILLHGLTFDHRMWQPVMQALPDGRRAIAFDLPGHGASPMLQGRGLTPVVEAIREAVVAAGVGRPVVVGHSIGGPLASIYASLYPVAGVVSVDAPVRLEPFASQLRELAPQLAGAGFEQAWGMYRRSFRVDLVEPSLAELLEAGDRPSQRAVLAYQADILERPLEELVRWRDDGMARVAEAGIPYISLSSKPVDPADSQWLRERVPQAQLVVWPVIHHFPQLADPVGFAELVAAVR